MPAPQGEHELARLLPPGAGHEAVRELVHQHGGEEQDHEGQRDDVDERAEVSARARMVGAKIRVSTTAAISQLGARMIGAPTARPITQPDDRRAGGREALTGPE